MAKAVINLQKESGGIVKISPADGTGVTELVVPESGNLVSVDTAVTDNAIARYDGATGKLQDSGVSIDDSGNVGIGTNSPSNFAGYNALTITGENTSCGGVIELNNADGSSKAHMFNNGDTFIIGTVTNHQVRIRAGATNRLTIEANGHTTVGAPVVSESTGAQLRVEAPAANDSSTASILISRYSDNYSSAMWHNYDSSYNSESFNLSVSPGEGGTSLNGIYRKYSVLGKGMHKWFGATTLSNPMTLNSNGNLLVGTTIDNGVDKLQVNGSISATSINTGNKKLKTYHFNGTTPSLTGLQTLELLSNLNIDPHKIVGLNILVTILMSPVHKFPPSSGGTRGYYIYYDINRIAIDISGADILSKPYDLIITTIE